MRTLAIAIVVGWFVYPCAVHAQSDWTAVQRLAAGTRIRVEAGARRAEGALHSATDVELAVINGFGAIARFNRNEVERVEGFVGDPHPKRRGARKGALWSSLLIIPATLSAEMGGMDRKALPFAYCLILCGGAAVGAWMADDAQTTVIYQR
jgi:hypothetical protein